ncbi:hypothetical protein [Manganibacter manganicus]|uniref:Uncharacterized protein n=1 Tax=Manganibacter manganicus TaxID=1873176 RepID=A0A1V8RRE2_9HYPH|nr:hypothetical protein [Pseudaminobacter manganicus]OQM75694.1 hypothetical protein BFN67_17145 [Pseudaminobacter manganicus]
MSALITPVFVASASATTSTGPIDHSNPAAELVVEHAELALAGLDGGKVEGFVTIGDHRSGESGFD